MNPIAYELRTNPLFKPQRIKDPTRYTRKQKHKQHYLDVMAEEDTGKISFEGVWD